MVERGNSTRGSDPEIRQRPGVTSDVLAGKSGMGQTRWAGRFSSEVSPEPERSFCRRFAQGEQPPLAMRAQPQQQRTMAPRMMITGAIDESSSILWPPSLVSVPFQVQAHPCGGFSSDAAGGSAVKEVSFSAALVPSEGFASDDDVPWWDSSISISENI